MSESSDESDGEEDLDRTQIAGPAATGAKPKRAGKLKSGKEARVTCTVRYPQLWPHSQLTFVHNKREIRYEDLTIEEFVAGYGEILQTPNITEQEKSARLRHLVSLMYFAQQYCWWQRGLFVDCVRFFGLYTMNKLLSWPKGRPCLDLCCSGGIWLKLSKTVCLGCTLAIFPNFKDKGGFLVNVA